MWEICGVRVLVGDELVTAPFRFGETVVDGAPRDLILQINK